MAEEKQTLSTSCFETIKSAILSGEFLPGERLACEQLKERLGVGMSPVREALAKLTATELVTFQEHKGYQVKKMNAQELKDNILSFIEIESLALGLAIDAGDDDWEGSIVSALHRLQKIECGKKVDFSSWAPLNAAFHNALVSACPLKALSRIRGEFHLRHQWVVRLAFQSVNELEGNFKEHRQLAELAMAKKSDQAISLLRTHMTDGVDELIERFYGTS